MQWDARTRSATQFQHQLFRIPSTKLLTLSTGRTKIVCKECGSAGPRQVFTFFCTVQEYMEHPVPKALETHQTRIHSGATCEIRIGRSDSCSARSTMISMDAAAAATVLESIGRMSPFTASEQWQTPPWLQVISVELTSMGCSSECWYD